MDGEQFLFFKKKGKGTHYALIACSFPVTLTCAVVSVGIICSLSQTMCAFHGKRNVWKCKLIFPTDKLQQI